MMPFVIAEPYEDGLRHCKRYLCPDCGERLKQYSWVKEQESQEKKKPEKEEDNKNVRKNNRY